MVRPPHPPRPFPTTSCPSANRLLCVYVQIRAAHSLMSTIHSMKLLLLLSDETQIAKRRDAELRQVQAEKNDAQKKAAALLDELLSSERDDGTSSGNTRGDAMT